MKNELEEVTQVRKLKLRRKRDTWKDFTFQGQLQTQPVGAMLSQLLLSFTYGTE